MAKTQVSGFIILLALLLGCSKQEGGMQINLKSASSAVESLSLAKAFSPSDTFAPPVDLYGVNCVGVMLGYPSEGNMGTCTTESNETVSVATMGGLVPYWYGPSGTTPPTIVDVPGVREGRNYSVSVIGFDSRAAGHCQHLHPGMPFKAAGYSYPYLIGSAQPSEPAGPASVVNVSVAFNAQRAISSCTNNVLDFNGGVATSCSASADLGGPFVLDDEFFGHSVDMDDRQFIVGAPQSDTDNSSFGSAAIYSYNEATGEWDEYLLFQPEEGSNTNTSNFGVSVAISGRWAAVGAPNFNGTASSSGKVFVFEKSGEDWSWRSDIQIVGSAANEYMGDALSMTDQFLAVGRPGPGAGTNGKVDIYRLQSGTWVQEIVDITETGNTVSAASFGASVDISGNRMIVGAPNFSNGSAVDGGKVFVYEQTAVGSWALVGSPLVGATPASSGNYGFSVSIEGSNVAIGDPNANANDKGLVEVYSYNGSTWGSAVYSDVSTTLSEYLGFSVSLAPGRLAYSAGTGSPIKVVDTTLSTPVVIESFPVSSEDNVVSIRNGTLVIGQPMVDVLSDGLTFSDVGEVAIRCNVF